MAEVDLNDIASAGIQALQGSIDKLNELINQPGADLAGIEARIEALESKQADLRDMTLSTIQATDVNKQAIAAVKAAAAALNTEVANIKDVSTALATATKVATATGSLITALAPFA